MVSLWLGQTWRQTGLGRTASPPASTLPLQHAPLLTKTKDIPKLKTCYLPFGSKRESKNACGKWVHQNLSPAVLLNYTRKKVEDHGEGEESRGGRSQHSAGSGLEKF